MKPTNLSDKFTLSTNRNFSIKTASAGSFIDQAEVKHKAAIQLLASSPNSYSRLAEIYTTSGRKEDALEALNHAKVIFPTTPGIFWAAHIITPDTYKLSAEINHRLGKEQQAAKDRDTSDVLTPFLDLSILLRF